MSKFIVEGMQLSKFNFEEETTREGTFSIQYEGTEPVFGRTGLAPFWIADMDIKTPEAITEAMKKRLDNGIFGYTIWKNPKFFGPVKQWWKSRFDVDLTDDMITYAPSVLYTVSEAIRLNSEKGDGVILTMPTYNAFLKVLKGNDRRVVSCPLIEEDDYAFDFEQFEALCREPDNKVYVHCNPHNPTGRVWTKDELQRMKDICIQNDVFFVSDEIHMDFVRPKEKFVSMVELMEEGDPIIVTTGLGKTFNLASLPHSYFITKDDALKDKIVREFDHRYNVGTANSLVLAAIEAAYMECGDWVDELNDHLEGNFDYISHYIDEHLSDHLSFKKPESTYLAWISFKESGIPDSVMHKALVDVGEIAVSPGHMYDVSENGRFRMNVASSRKRIEEGMKRIHQTIDRLKEENKV